MYMWPSLLHQPPRGDIFYKQNPWEQQDATTSDEENFANEKSLSQSSISNHKMFDIAHQESDHWTISNTEDRALRNEFPDVNGYQYGNSATTTGGGGGVGGGPKPKVRNPFL